ncbi:MAG: hypothetical protein H0T42_17895 [Deltaproteobacteria bacterium]|nr:hypothetical protein [Deltaproteobacteria bacterium]
MRLAITSLAALLTTSGCLLHTPGGGDDQPPHPTEPATPKPVASGNYQVTSTVEITIEALLPEPAASLVETMRDFSTNPGQTLFNAAEDAGVPAVGTIRSALPDYLEDKLEGWINAEVAKMTVDGVPVTQHAATLVAYAETSLSTVAVESELSLAGGMATHRLTTLDLTPAGLDIRLALDAVPSDIVTATAPATTTSGTLTIGDHLFAVSYGEYAWQALEAKVTAEHGAGIRITLGAAVNCPLVAARVASKCVLGVCVGHPAELTSICERGLDEIVDRAHAKLASFRFDVLHLEAGRATVVEDGLANGIWTAEINAGQGLRHAPATFSATR